MRMFRYWKVNRVIFGATALTYLLCNPATGQDTCYRVTRIKELNFTPETSNTSDDVFGINNNGEIAFTVAVDVGGGVLKKHAFVWLPADNYGLSAGLHDLHSPAAGEESTAHDINNSGQVVGQVLQIGQFNVSEAAAWQLGSGVISLCKLGTIFGGDWASAFAINDENPPVVVGEAASNVPRCTSAPTGFRGPIQDLLLCQFGPFDRLTPAGTNASTAKDVNTIPPEDPQIAAFEYDATTPLCINGTPCEPSKEALEWKGPTITTLLHPSLLGGVEARGNNNNEEIVGWAFTNLEKPCRRRALFWASPVPGEEPFNLHTQASPAIPTLQESRADEINNLGNPQVVGSNTFTEQALLWNNQSASQWDLVVLDDVTAPCANGFIAAFDINDSGWIVGWGDFPPGGPVSAQLFLLTPHQACVVTCNADLVPDCVVGFLDLGQLLNNWGDCPPLPGSCREDLDCDGSVGFLDQAILLNAWGLCLDCTPPASAQGGGGSAPSGLTLEQALAVMGFASVDDYIAWGEKATDAETKASGQVLLALLGG